MEWIERSGVMELSLYCRIVTIQNVYRQLTFICFLDMLNCGGSRNFKTGGAVPALYNFWRPGIVLIHYDFVVRIENEIHIVNINIAC